MKQIKLIGLSVFAAVVMIACNSNSAGNATQVEEGITGTFSADVATSAVNWKGGMIGGIKSHNGSLSLSEGSITMDNGAITGGEFVVDMKSITPLDENYGETEHTKADLVGHLSAGDFFLIDSFPTASFKITGADSTGVMGDLTIRGITNSEKIVNVVVDTTSTGVKVMGDLTFNRQNYNVTFDTKSKEAVLSNDIELKFEVVAQP